MAEIVNLRRARKQKGREEARKAGAASAAKAGEGKAAREVRAAEAEIAARRLEGHKREVPED